MLGITFKENCPDIRNTRVVDIVRELEEYGTEVEIFDPWADADEVNHEYGLTCYNELNGHRYDAAVLAVAHDQFKELDIRSLLAGEHGVVYDVKGVFDQTVIEGRL
jgi:UDP-N-acetyl-D-galactosamine dehydrogenase